MSEYSDLILAESALVSYWRLNESSGTSAADSEGSNTGTYAGGVTLAQPGALVGDADLAASFDGADDKVTTTYNPFTNGTVRVFEAWVWRRTSTSGDAILSGNVSAGPAIRLNSGGANLNFWSDVAANVPVTWASGISVGSWAHVVLIFDEGADTAELFVNGVSKGVQTTTVAYNATPGNFQIGTRGTGADWFDGLIDEPAIYNASLPAAQVAAHHNAGRQTRRKSLHHPGRAVARA